MTCIIWKKMDDAYLHHMIRAIVKGDAGTYSKAIIVS
jgi:hypothetical protein